MTVPDANDFNNLRSQMSWQMREDLRDGRIDLSRHEALFGQLTMPRLSVRHGKTIVGATQETRKRSGGASPDDADAVVRGEWVRPRHAEKVDTDN